MVVRSSSGLVKVFYYYFIFNDNFWAFLFLCFFFLSFFLLLLFLFCPYLVVVASSNHTTTTTTLCVYLCVCVGKCFVCDKLFFSLFRCHTHLTHRDPWYVDQGATGNMFAITSYESELIPRTKREILCVDHFKLFLDRGGIKGDNEVKSKQNVVPLLHYHSAVFKVWTESIIQTELVSHNWFKLLLLELACWVSSVLAKGQYLLSPLQFCVCTLPHDLREDLEISDRFSSWIDPLHLPL